MVHQLHRVQPALDLPHTWPDAQAAWDDGRLKSKGGRVNAQVFDHTSILRFLERRFGVMEPNISAWRRAVRGDLADADVVDDPLIRCLFSDSSGAYRRAQSRRLRGLTD